MHLASSLPLKRLSRPETPPAGRLIERDVAMIESVGRFRFLYSTQIAEMVAHFEGGSLQGVLRRLQLLYYWQYLTRPPQQHTQLAAFSDQGNRPLVYGLDKLGAELLANKYHTFNRHDWKARNTRASATFLEHTLATADAVLAFERACRAHGGLAVTDHAQLLPYFPEATRRLPDPFRLAVTIPPDGKRPTIRNRKLPTTGKVAPDRLFSVHDKDDKAKFSQTFALELDRGTMDISRRYRAKLETYFHARGQERHREQWGCSSFRVLTITTSETRIQHMLFEQIAITDGTVPGFFAYSTPERIKQHGALGPAWITSKEDGVCLVRS